MLVEQLPGGELRRCSTVAGGRAAPITSPFPPPRRGLDLYQGRWQGKLLHPGDFVLCADEKPSIQARRRKHESLPPAPGNGQRVEHEYERMGALCYFAAWDVKRAKIFGRCEATSGIDPFDRLLAQVIGIEPYASARPATRS